MSWLKKKISKLVSPLKRSLLGLINLPFNLIDFKVVNKKELVDFYIHKYDSYEQYKNIQMFHNKRKITKIWADETTLRSLCDELKKIYPDQTVKGICHGTRNGFEQKIISDYAEFEVIGTDISDTVAECEKTIQWDFHKINEKWIAKFDFVYSNSLDQAWNPRVALTTWLNQLNNHGVLVIEHSKEGHGPRTASEMDPFGVRPTVLPYILSEWFGHQISISFIRSEKDNNGCNVWLFFIKKNVPTVN